METYGGLDSVAMVTLAPELDGSQSVIRDLCQKGITVSLGEHPKNPRINTALRRCVLQLQKLYYVHLKETEGTLAIQIKSHTAKM